MPVIIPSNLSEQCFQPIQLRPIPDPVAELPPNWLSLLAELMAKEGNYSIWKLGDLKLFLNEVAGERSSYISRRAVAEHLKIIYDGYSRQDEHQFSPAIRLALLQQIYEDERLSCHIGIHARIEGIISDLRGQGDTVDGILSNIRTSIVNSAARKYSSDVHSNNWFFQIAAEEGYAPVHKGIDEDDFGRRAIIYLRAKINKRLASDFAKKYRPLPILNELISQIKGTLATRFAYTGKKPAGYVNGDYDKFNVFLDGILGQEGVQRMLLDEEHGYVATELDWTSIKLALLDKLCNEGYFRLTPAQIACLKSLLEDEIPVAGTLSPLFTEPDCLIKNAEDLCSLFDWAGDISLQTRVDILHEYIQYVEETYMDIPEKLGELYFSLLETFGDNLQINEELLIKSSIAYIQKVEGVDFNQPRFLSLVLKKYPAITSLMLQHIEESYTAQEKAQALLNKTTGTCLDLAIKYCPSELPTLVRMLCELEPLQRKIAFSYDYTTNALGHAIQRHFAVVPALLRAIEVHNTPRGMARVLQYPAFPYARKRSNLFLLGIEHGPSELISTIFEIVGRLPPATQKNLLYTKNEAGKTAFQLLAKHHPQHIELLLALAPVRLHSSPVEDISNDHRYGDLKGDALKRRIMSHLCEQIAGKTTQEELREFQTSFRDSVEYEILASGQDFTTRFFKLKTTSITQVNHIFDERFKGFAEAPGIALR